MEWSERMSKREKTNVNPSIIQEYEYQEGSDSAGVSVLGLERAAVDSNVFVFIGTLVACVVVVVVCVRIEKEK